MRTAVLRAAERHRIAVPSADVRWAPTALRSFVGLVFVLHHGRDKVVELAAGGTHFVDAVAALGFPAPRAFAWAAALTQVGAGLLLLAGVAVRPAAFALAGTMIVALFETVPAGFAAAEPALTYAVLCALLVAVGPGRATPMETPRSASEPADRSGASNRTLAWVPAAIVLARVALGTAFLSAVADRFGVWGPTGAPGVAWGEWTRFVAYTADVNAFLPWGLAATLAPALAVLVTAAELVLSAGLLAGIRVREVSVASGALLLAFGGAMALSLGIKKPLDYSVFSAAAGAFLLAAAAGLQPGRAAR